MNKSHYTGNEIMNNSISLVVDDSDLPHPAGHRGRNRRGGRR